MFCFTKLNHNDNSHSSGALFHILDHGCNINVNKLLYFLSFFFFFFFFFFFTKDGIIKAVSTELGHSVVPKPVSWGTSLTPRRFHKGPFYILNGFQYMKYKKSGCIYLGSIGPIFYVERVINA